MRKAKRLARGDLRALCGADFGELVAHGLQSLCKIYIPPDNLRAADVRTACDIRR